MKELSGLEQSTWAIIIFLAVYAFLITEKISRSVVALAGAVMMVIAGILDVEAAFTHYIEWDTITLLIGMMILVGITNKTGVFQYIAIKSAKAAGGNPIRILVILSLLTAVLSALLDNVTTVLLVVPVTFSITRILRVNPVPFLISEVVASNIGGTATLIGDPPNIMIGSAIKHLTFVQFIIHLAPIAAVILIVILVLLYFIYRGQFHAADSMEKLNEINERDYIREPLLMKKSLAVLALTMLGFVLHSFIHIEASVIAVAGAAILMLIGLRENEIEEALDFVEWQSIFFFAGLFTLVGGLQEVGVIKNLAAQVLEITDGNIPLASILILWGSGIISGVIDNIPFVATMIPLIRDMAAGLGYSIASPEINTLWWSLALGACLGGNSTIIGASANVIVASLAAREGKGFSYWEFFKIGAPVTFVSLIMATIYVYFRYLTP
ncbi:ArsB/NhaD family transporter [Paenactinomyces guangxiensis]|uniref:ArsB/NhaD family transporter n=1 Tax=Paenactinomyces guangxiensis TaxID=1490290 RepID=A0A7W2A903_9BACL|nr:ArsB/NhaD family transporter [Paenactinomyces guangxiensis]MBA4496126.1 ArsB/NhaD family transporter [Paenactinomyces guangxiensis]MBH8593214.1 ArsB/NhaD family transporter [Paenactinomyces guangxiensis]